MTDSSLQIRAAALRDEAVLLALLPRLAEFELAPQRNPDDLWQSDAKLLQRVLRNDAPDTFVYVAADAETDAPAGMAMVTLQGEFMSGAPGAHLEVLAVVQGFEGRGVGTTLLAAAEAEAARRGAQSLTLHVFTKNYRAHRLYEALGYDSEVQRCIKWLPSTEAKGADT